MEFTVQGKKFLRAMVAVAVGFASLLFSAGPARADVIIPPGGYGHVCSGYDSVAYLVKWQTCAWADNNEVYFTVNFKNDSSSAFTAELVTPGFYVNGERVNCAKIFDFRVPASSVKSTPTAGCVRTRVRSAYQAIGFVAKYPYQKTLTSDSLQVQ